MKMILSLASFVALAVPAHAEQVMCVKASMSDLVATFLQRGFTAFSAETLTGKTDYPMTIVKDANGAWLMIYAHDPKETCFFASGHSIEAVGANTDGKSY